MQIRVPLPVGVAHGVDRGVVHEERDVGAVVDVEAAQEVLLRLASAAVLHREEARHGLEHALGAIAGHERQLGLARARIGPRDVRTCQRGSPSTRTSCTSGTGGAEDGVGAGAEVDDVIPGDAVGGPDGSPAGSCPRAGGRLEQGSEGKA